MKKFSLVLITCAHILLVGCAVKPLITDHYKLSSYSKKQLTNKPSHHSIFVSAPDAVAGYQGEEMLYSDTPFELTPFVHNSWVDQPADMLLPLLTQSLQRSGYFHVVASSPGTAVSEYRLDTQLIELQQSFLTKPSTVTLVVKIVLVHVDDDRAVASRIIRNQVTSPTDTPYGGVIAANCATKLFTAAATDFIVRRIRGDTRS